MDLTVVHAFLDRVKKMQVGRSKEMRMTYDEAHALSLVLAQLMAKKLEQATADTGPTTIIMHGGSLKPS